MTICLPLYLFISDNINRPLINPYITQTMNQLLLNYDPTGRRPTYRDTDASSPPWRITEASSANLTSVTGGDEQTDPPVRWHEPESSGVVAGDSALSGALTAYVPACWDSWEDWEQNWAAEVRMNRQMEFGNGTQKWETRRRSCEDGIRNKTTPWMEMFWTAPPANWTFFWTLVISMPLHATRTSEMMSLTEVPVGNGLLI